VIGDDNIDNQNLLERMHWTEMVLNLFMCQAWVRSYKGLLIVSGLNPRLVKRPKDVRSSNT